MCFQRTRGRNARWVAMAASQLRPDPTKMWADVAPPNKQETEAGVSVTGSFLPNAHQPPPVLQSDSIISVYHKTQLRSEIFSFDISILRYRTPGSMGEIVSKQQSIFFFFPSSRLGELGHLRTAAVALWCGTYTPGGGGLDSITLKPRRGSSVMRTQPARQPRRVASMCAAWQQAAKRLLVSGDNTASHLLCIAVFRLRRSVPPSLICFGSNFAVRVLPRRLGNVVTGSQMSARHFTSSSRPRRVELHTHLNVVLVVTTASLDAKQDRRA